MKIFKKIIFTISMCGVLGCSPLEKVQDTAITVVGLTYLTVRLAPYVLPELIKSDKEDTPDLVCTYYTTGELKTETRYRFERATTKTFSADGILLTVDEDGKILEEYWESGLPKKIGKKTYHPNGELASEPVIWSDYPVYYNPAGEKNLISREEKRKKGGVFTTYFKDGKIASVENYTDGMKNGEFLLYTREGILISKEIYLKDKLNGISYNFFPNGNTLSEISYKDGKINGSYKQFFKDGKLFVKSTYINDLKDGLEEIYYFNGQLYKKTYYSKGMKNGIEETYSPTGVIQSRFKYKNDKLNGKYEVFYKDGILNYMAIYLDDNCQETKYFYPNGKIKSETFYNSKESYELHNYFDENGVKDKSTLYIDSEIITVYYENGVITDEESSKKWEQALKKYKIKIDK